MKMKLVFPKYKKFEDVDNLIEECNKIKVEIIEVVDACMSMQPQRRDIIQMYMNTLHAKNMEVLSRYWEKNATNISAFDTLSLIDWVYTYLKDLKKFGITDMFL